ncbi:MAG: tetratricopeptide repeat protein [Thermococci archaeon]|nr:tetratricopeptide repeat protein [Thermococci archaeon]
MEEVDEVKAMAERGLFEEALQRAWEIEDRALRVEAVIEVARAAVKLKPDLSRKALEKASQWMEGVKDPHTRAILLSKMAFVYHLLGDSNTDLFDEALNAVFSIDDRLELGSVLSVVAYYMAVSGLPDEAYQVFNDAFDVIMEAEVDYRTKLDTIIEMAGLIEGAGDELPPGDAIRFYEMAYDIFDKLRINTDAVRVEKKMNLAKTLRNHGTPELRRLLLEGKFVHAVNAVEKKLRGRPDLFLALLEIALWMKKIKNPGYLDVLDRAMSKLQKLGELDAETIEKSAVVLTEMGELKKALEFTMRIKDTEKRDQALAAIALKLAEDGFYEGARKVAYAIKDMNLKKAVMDEITVMEGEKNG